MSIGPVSGVSPSTQAQQLQQIMMQYGCNQTQAQQILNGQSPEQVLGTQSSSSGTEEKHKGGHHPVTLTKTETDPTTGQSKTLTVTANSKSEVESYEAQGYTIQDNKSVIQNQQAAMSSIGQAQISMQK